MTPERWRQIDDLLQKVLAHPPAERAAILDAACGSDQEWRREVESLVALREKATQFLETPVIHATSAILCDHLVERLIGKQIGPYKLLAQLGAGGMGEVYLAADTKLDRHVAIKFLSSHLAFDEKARHRLIREAQAAAKLDHANICPIHEIREEADHTFIVMQYVEGMTLGSRRTLEPFGLLDTLDVGAQVAAALVEAHSRGIVHRDIKPQNIMIMPRGQVKVLDFGLAKVIGVPDIGRGEEQANSQLSAPGLILGTVAYMSPEQARGSPVDGRSDLFSLGVVLYECITGKGPFETGNPGETRERVLRLVAPAPSTLNPQVNPALDKLIEKALAKDPEARYQTAAEMLADLRTVRRTLGGVESGPNPAPRLKTDKPVPEPESGFRRTVFVGLILFFVAFGLIAVLAASDVVHIFPFARTSARSQSAARDWYEAGIRAIHRGSYNSAENALRLALQADNKFVLAHARRAEALAYLDDGQAAEAEISEATSLAAGSTLESLEPFYLQAIAHLIRRELPSAVERYQEIVRQAPEEQKTYAYLDLGRACEANDEIERAIASYREVIKRDPREAAAFLRLGVLYERKQEKASALEAFDNAEEIYRGLTDLEGQAEVSYQRAVLYNSRGQMADARAHLARALSLSKTTENTHQQIRALLQLCVSYYLQGDNGQAEERAMEAVRLAKENRRKSLEALAMIELGNTAIWNDNRSRAEEYFHQALDLAIDAKARRIEATARLSLGNARIFEHDVDAGVPYVEQALEFFESGSYRKEVAKALTLLARARNLKGEYESALQALDEQFAIAERLDDPSQKARVKAESADVLANLERFPEAVRSLDESLELYEPLGQHVYSAFALADRANILWRLGRYRQADEDLRRAALLGKREQSERRNLKAKVVLIEASMLLSQRRFAEARSRAQEALDLNAESEHAVEARYTLGLAQMLSGLKVEGKRNCDLAFNSLRPTAPARLTSNAHLALAEALVEGGHASAALEIANKAQSDFAIAKQPESEWRALVVASRASSVLGDQTAARASAARASASLSSLEHKWSAEFYRDYTRRPDVQYRRSTLDPLLEHR